MRHVCEQTTTLSKHNTEIALLKQMSNGYEKELNEIKEKLDSNTTLLITSLIGVILSLLAIIGGIIVFIIENIN